MLNREKLGTALALITLGFVATSCGKQEYKEQTFESAASASGFQTIPAKIDIVIVPDNSGSITAAFNTVQSQLSGFASSLQSKGWDYHVARSAMLNPRPITQALVNPSFNSPTLPDGTPNPNATFLVPSGSAINNPSDFQIQDTIYAGSGCDPTYSNTYNNISAAIRDSRNIIRRDAPLAVIVLTNGAECVDRTGYGDVNTTALNSWANSFIGLKGSPLMIKFYPVAARGYYNGTTASCLVPGGTALYGTSYTSMLSYISGLSGDFCNSGALSSVLSNIESDLSSYKRAFITTKIVMDVEPDLGSLRVYKNGTQLNRDTSRRDGWDWEGHHPEGVYTINGIEGSSATFQANKRAGWVIGLYGFGVLRGEDTYRLEYTRR